MYYRNPLRPLTAADFNITEEDIQKAIQPTVESQKRLQLYRNYINGKNITDVIIEFRPFFGYETHRFNVNCGETEMARIVDKYDFDSTTLDNLSKLVDMMKKKSGD